MIFEKNDKIIFIGDSVTDCGREAFGEGILQVGTGYVQQVQTVLDAQCPELSLRIINKGTSGNTIRDIKTRWEQDVLAHSPGWVCLMVGINDVWRQFDCPNRLELHVSLEEYTATLEELVAQTLPRVKGMLLMSPVYIEPNLREPLRAMLDTYQAAMRSVAKKHGLVYVDAQASFDRYLQHRHSSAISWDRIHPNPVGHMILATALLNHIGFEWQPK